jgi:DNA mismatch endonuclease (patch repair protein)
MQSNRPHDTRPEVAVRSALHRLGYRYRKHYRPLPGVRCEVDIAFPNRRLAILLDGCFWHGCPEHATRPVTNRDWWKSKLDKNVARDRVNDAMLFDAGWTVLRFWEHQGVNDIVAAVEVALGVLIQRVREDASGATSV